MTERRCEARVRNYGVDWGDDDPDSVAWIDVPCGARIIEGRCRECGTPTRRLSHGARMHAYDGFECTEGHPVAAEAWASTRTTE